MPYETRTDLPNDVQRALSNVPHAQDIYREAFNSAFEQYGGDESRAHRVAWAAVKRDYEKGDDGKWHPRE
ncbi:MAG: ChaB family protein [Lysobacterales bacterium]|jgi:cation transport regulator